MYVYYSVIAVLKYSGVCVFGRFLVVLNITQRKKIKKIKILMRVFLFFIIYYFAWWCMLICSRCHARAHRLAPSPVHMCLVCFFLFIVCIIQRLSFFLLFFFIFFFLLFLFSYDFSWLFVFVTFEFHVLFVCVVSLRYSSDYNVCIFVRCCESCRVDVYLFCMNMFIMPLFLLWYI